MVLPCSQFSLHFLHPNLCSCLEYCSKQTPLLFCVSILSAQMFPCQRRRPHVRRNRSLARHLPRLIFFLLLLLRLRVSSSSSSWCHVCTPKSHERPVGPAGASRAGSRWDPLPGQTRLSGSCNSLANFLDGDLAIWHALNKIESKHTCHM